MHWVSQKLCKVGKSWRITIFIFIPIWLKPHVIVQGTWRTRAEKKVIWKLEILVFS